MTPHAATDRLELAIIRGLLAIDVCEPLDRARVLTLLAARLDAHRTRSSEPAVSSLAGHDLPEDLALRAGWRAFIS